LTLLVYPNNREALSKVDDLEKSRAFLVLLVAFRLGIMDPFVHLPSHHD
jgi:hypothetical protein